ncbi:hypothetical protein Q8A73_021246 [Channa argus]|nr:hypothetical protein Q8A73_021246 [Channa argus]
MSHSSNNEGLGFCCKCRYGYNLTTKLALTQSFALKVSFAVTMHSASLETGCVTMTTTAGATRMKETVQLLVTQEAVGGLRARAGCDGVDDCGDLFDKQLSYCCEINITNITYEMLTRFLCANSYYIYASRLCGRKGDRGDGSDEREELCPEPTLPPCTLEEFKCTDKQCVAIPYICDHNDNCGDHTDVLCCYIIECEMYDIYHMKNTNMKGFYKRDVPLDSEKLATAHV